MARVRHDRGEIAAHIQGPRLIMLLVVFTLLLIGFVMIFSTSSVIAISNAESPDAANPMGELIGQIIYAVLGIIVALIIWKVVPCSVWQSNFVWIVWAVGFLLLLLTAVAGTGDEEWGARRWLMIGPSSLQASEFAKIALILVAARLITDFRDEKYTFSVFIGLVVVLILLPVGMIMGLQSDLGTAMICVVGIFAVMWLGEVPLKTILIIAAVIVAVGLYGVLGSDYRRARLMVFTDPWNDGQNGYGTGYQIIHSLYALAEGGLFGVGLGNSHEKYLYLTQSDSDFIFAIIGEELGLVGAVLVVALFLLFLYAGMRIVRAAPDNFSAMIAGGCTLMIVFQAFLNILMVVGCFPVVGKPLPFISSGGSSLIATFIMVGLILSVSRGAEAPSIYEQRRNDLRVVRAEKPASSESSRQGRR